MDSIVDIFDHIEIQEQKQSLLKKCIERRQKIYKDISKDHFTQDEQIQIEPYLKIHSQLTEKNLMNDMKARPLGLLAVAGCVGHAMFHGTLERTLSQPVYRKIYIEYMSSARYFWLAGFVYFFTVDLNDKGPHQKSGFPSIFRNLRTPPFRVVKGRLYYGPKF